MNSLCTLQQLNPEQEQDLVKTLRLTLREDQSPERTDTAKVKPVGRAFALVSSRPLHGSRSLNSELIKSTDGDEEIIKVYLKAKAEDKANHEWNVSQLRNEVRHIQEARTSIKNLREEIEPNSCKSGKEERLLNKDLQNGVRHYRDSSKDEMEEEFTLDNGKDLRETAQRLYAKLQEVEKKQQNERMLYEDKLSRCRQEMEQSNRARREAQHSSVQHQKEVEDLRRLLISMENEHQELQKKMKENEEELESVRAQKQQDGPLQARCEELEKTVSGLKEKIHHLDDMLKSQQRKVRQMIEQLQNSRTAMQEKDSLIQDLREKVSWLQAENLELQDKLEHFASSQSGNTYRLPRSYSRPNLQNVKRVYIPSGSGRPFPVIKLVET
ncbi:tuftelin isoform X1 [Spea bombifrons]|uniref:tuftelin isoform X1 n=1 Tax=Spea bombifrons TaxID=233779 RepID=UPI00234A0B64|nr:tuftelin isoform X1 [Spea bombifrons]